MQKGIQTAFELSIFILGGQADVKAHQKMHDRCKRTFFNQIILNSKKMFSTVENIKSLFYLT